MLDEAGGRWGAVRIQGELHLPSKVFLDTLLPPLLVVYCREISLIGVLVFLVKMTTCILNEMSIVFPGYSVM